MLPSFSALWAEKRIVNFLNCFSRRSSNNSQVALHLYECERLKILSVCRCFNEDPKNRNLICFEIN